jgi:acetyl-CoA carboxylase biotin carboxylase subunit
LGFECDFEESLPEALLRPTDPGAWEGASRMLAAWRAPQRGSCFVAPGVSEWASRPELSQIAQAQGVTVLAPPARVLSLYQNQLSFLEEAHKLRVPHLVVSFEPLQSVREVKALLARLTDQSMETAFPIVLKSIRGRLNGFGVRVFRSLEELERDLPLWSEQLKRLYNQAIFYLENYREAARFVGVPFARSVSGEWLELPRVDASLMSRCRKLIELCPARGLDPKQDHALSEWTKAIAESTHFIGVGMMEYLVDGSRVFLVEGTPSLSLSFPLWEKISGLKAAELQLLSQAQAEQLPHVASADASTRTAVALHIYAENSLTQIPAPGFVQEISGGREVAIAVPPRSRIPYQGEGLVATVCTEGDNHCAALSEAQKALESFWVAGSLQTNTRMLSEILEHPWIQERLFHASFIDEDFIPDLRAPEGIASLMVSLCEPMLDLGERSRKGDPVWFVGTQVIRQSAGDQIRWEGASAEFVSEGRRGRSGYIRVNGGAPERVCIYPLSESSWMLRVGRSALPVKRVLRSLDPKPPQLFAQAEGRIHAVWVREGTVVPAHAPILVLESLHTLVPHALPVSVRIVQLNVKSGDVVRYGQSLAILEKF